MEERCTTTHNSFPHNHNHKAESFGKWTNSFLASYQKAQIRNNTQAPKLKDKYLRAPVQGNSQYYSSYVDMAYNEPLNIYAIARAIFDPGGNIWATGYQKITPPGSIMAAEINAIKNGAKFWKEHQLGPLTVFFDSLDAIRSIYTNTHYRGVEENLIMEIKQMVNDTSMKGV